MKTLLSIFLLAAAAYAANKPAQGQGQGRNGSVAVEATLRADRESIKQLIGNDLGGFYVVVEVKLTPNGSFKVDRDDFLLRTDRDGERSKPFQGSQIAGRGSMVVSSVSGGGGGMMQQESGPAWGGIGGGMPGQLGGQGSGIGNTADPTLADAKVDDGHKRKVDPLQAVLDGKILKNGEITEPASGLLYFPMEPKQKVKDLELIVTTPTGKLMLRFK